MARQSALNQTIVAKIALLMRYARICVGAKPQQRLQSRLEMAIGQR